MSRLIVVLLLLFCVVYSSHICVFSGLSCAREIMAEIEEESNQGENSQNCLKKLSEFPVVFYSQTLWFDTDNVRNLINFHYCYSPLASVVILPGENPPEDYIVV